MKSKKGAELSVTTIVIIVLALIVLVVLVIGFTSGWSNLWGRITSFFGGGSNVDSVVQACTVACTTRAEYDYCSRMRTVKFDDGTSDKYNCPAVVTLNVGLSPCEPAFTNCVDKIGNINTD